MASREVSINVTTAIAIGSLVMVIMGSMWAVFQSETSFITKDDENRSSEIKNDINLLRNDLARREIEIKDTIKSIQNELDRRRAEFVNQDEHKEFKLRIENKLASVDEQIKLLDSRIQLRPVRGEIEARSKQRDDQLAESARSLRREIDTMHQQIEHLNQMLLDQQMSLQPKKQSADAIEMHPR